MQSNINIIKWRQSLQNTHFVQPTQMQVTYKMNHFVILYGYTTSVTSTYAVKYLPVYKVIMKQGVSNKNVHVQ